MASTTHIFLNVRDPIFDDHETAIMVSPGFISACISEQQLLPESDFQVAGFFWSSLTVIVLCYSAGPGAQAQAYWLIIFSMHLIGFILSTSATGPPCDHWEIEADFKAQTITLGQSQRWNNARPPQGEGRDCYSAQADDDGGAHADWSRRGGTAHFDERCRAQVWTGKRTVLILKFLLTVQGEPDVAPRPRVPLVIPDGLCPASTSADPFYPIHPACWEGSCLPPLDEVYSFISNNIDLLL